MTTRQDGAVSGRIVPTDIDGDAPTVSGPVDGPSNGIVMVNEDGTFTYQPRYGFYGTDSFVVQVSDGHGGFDLVTVTITVLSEPSIAALPVDTQPAILAMSPASIIPERVGGIILDAVGRLSGQASSGLDHAAPGIVINAVNSIQRLEMAALSGGNGDQDAGPIARIADLTGLAERASTVFPMSRGFWDAQALTGYSLRMVVGDEHAEYNGSGSNRIVVDSLMRDRVTFLQISNTLDHDRHGYVERYKVLQADGRPLPDWVDAAANGMLLVQAPIAGGTLEFEIIATLTDGSTIERGAILFLDTGHLRESATSQSPAQLFDQQVRRRNAQ